MAFTFPGGIRPDEHKYTKNSPIEEFPAPAQVSIPLSQHVGVMCKPLVRVGDPVRMGQMIGDVAGGLGCPVHASVSGTVVRIDEVTGEHGGVSYNIVIDNDGKNTLAETVRPFGKRLSEATPDEIIAAVRAAGITGMGSAAFPTYAKIAAARARTDLIIVNCIECEPFVCGTHRLILEDAAAIFHGLKILMVATGAREAWIAAEVGKREELATLQPFVEKDEMLQLKKVTSKYPSGSEKQLVYALTKQEISGGRTPLDAGIIVFNAQTCAAVYHALAKGMPLIRRIVTVDGDCISTPKNLSVPIGTRIEDLIDYCGGLSAEPKKIVCGGPMMGQAIWDSSAPVSKTTSAVLFLSEFFDHESKLPPVCIRCGRCVRACPARLMPLKIAAAIQKNRVDIADELGALSCIECGSCSYVCPGAVPVAQLVSRARTAVLAVRRQQNEETNRATV